MILLVSLFWIWEMFFEMFLWRKWLLVRGREGRIASGQYLPTLLVSEHCGASHDLADSFDSSSPETFPCCDCLLLVDKFDENHDTKRWHTSILVSPYTTETNYESDNSKSMASLSKIWFGLPWSDSKMGTDWSLPLAAFVSLFLSQFPSSSQRGSTNGQDISVARVDCIVRQNKSFYWHKLSDRSFSLRRSP
jgi:hypothetical protein